MNANVKKNQIEPNFYFCFFFVYFLASCKTTNNRKLFFCTVPSGLQLSTSNKGKVIDYKQKQIISFYR